ncbi:hypothetical protein EBO16_20445 [Salmonella enterica]|nr:hypothetical protein [Salmonella enterica]
MVVYVPPESPSAENGPQGGGRQRELRHQAQWPYTPSGVQGAPHPARPEKTDGTTTACGGHWYTTPAQVKTEKTARHLQLKKVKFLHFFYTYLLR